MLTPNIVEEALTANRIVLSVIGPHAGESMDEIFSRKIEDIKVTGKTFWLYASHITQPTKVHSFFSEKGYVVFLEPSAKNGSRPTTNTNKASGFSTDKESWQNFPEDLSPVTGKAGYALVLSDLLVLSQNIIIDLWKYSNNNQAILFKLGASTLLAEKKDSSLDPSKMLSRFRRVAAVAKICDPVAVWVR